MSVVHHEHDWLSDTYVREWIESDATRDAERRPKLRRAASLLPHESAQSIRVLDLGGGYGEFARQVLELFPNSTVVLHDYSPPMIDAASERLAEFGGRVEFRLSDLSRPGWSYGLGGPFDAVVSSIAVHNLRQPALIHDVYREVATVVGPGGAFLNLDYIFPRSPLLSDLYGRASGGGRGTGATGAGGHVEQATLENQLRWLLEGFDEVDCLWKELREVLLCGLRAKP